MAKTSSYNGKGLHLVSHQKCLSRSRRSYRTTPMKKKISVPHTTSKGRCEGTRLVFNHKSLDQSRRSYRAMLRYLVRAGCRINSTDFKGETALHLAVKYDDFEAARQLMRLGADVDRKNLRGQTPLQVAVVNRSHVDVLTNLIPNGNGILYNQMNFRGIDSLRFAIAGRDRDAINGVSLCLVKMLLDAGANVNTKDNNGCSPLQCAIYTGDDTLVKILIDAGADINNWNRRGATPLHDAVLCCNKSLVYSLLSCGANVAAKTLVLGNTALHWASILNIGNSHEGIIQNLLKFGSELNGENHLGLTPFNCIVESSDVNLVSRCITEHGADLNMVASHGGNALAFAVQNPDKKVMDLALESGLEIDHKCVIGQTSLHLACLLAMLENVRRLISMGADINAKDVRGTTPLASCILGPYVRAYMTTQSQLLLDRANFAEERRQVIRLLLECGSDMNQKVFLDSEQNQATILELSISFEEDIEALDVIIQHAAEVEARLNKPLLDEYNLKLIDEEPEIKSYYQMCQDELMAMRTTKIEDTTITYFSVLTEPLDVVARYTRNENFIKTFEAGDYETAYDIYASRLREKVDAATARQKMIDKTCTILSKTLRFADSSHPAIELIFKYLSETDVKLLIGSA